MTRLFAFSTAFWCTVLSSGASAEDQNILAVTSPIELQVTQRNQNNQADIIIAGTIADKVDLVEAKAELPAGKTNGKAVAWTTIATRQQFADGKFSGKLTLEAGGWYTISIRARSGEQVSANSRVDKVGVGEVFITAGQSNSANHGTRILT